MARKKELLLDEALRLSEENRVDLTVKLIESLETPRSPAFRRRLALDDRVSPCLMTFQIGESTPVWRPSQSDSRTETSLW